MSLRDDELLRILSQQNEEFRLAVQEHRELDLKIAKLDEKRFLSPTEDLEKKRLQKIKLKDKDKITRMIRDYKDLKDPA